jgi:hypothetical protein
MNIKKYIRNPKVFRFIETVIGSFLGMIIALAWSDFFNAILKPLQSKFVFLGVVGYLFYALLITFLTIFFIIIFVNFLTEDDNN